MFIRRGESQPLVTHQRTLWTSASLPDPPPSLVLGGHGRDTARTHSILARTRPRPSQCSAAGRCRRRRTLGSGSSNGRNLGPLSWQRMWSARWMVTELRLGQPGFRFSQGPGSRRTRGKGWHPHSKVAGQKAAFFQNVKFRKEMCRKTGQRNFGSFWSPPKKSKNYNYLVQSTGRETFDLFGGERVDVKEGHPPPSLNGVAGWNAGGSCMSQAGKWVAGKKLLFPFPLRVQQANIPPICLST